jgi:Molybdopterin oxidoreductase
MRTWIERSRLLSFLFVKRNIPIRPGTDGALALGMINMILHEDLIDHDYVEKYTLGFDELKQRASIYPPEKVAAITGVPANHIRQLAREYATTQASVIRIDVAIERHAGGGQAVCAVTCLPALVGAWRHVGGGLLQMPVWAFPIQWGTLIRHTELFRRLARVMGSEDPFFQRSDTQMVRESLDWNQPALAGITLELLQGRG